MVGIFDRDRNFFRTDLLSERESEKGGESDRKIPHSGAFDLYCPDFSGMWKNHRMAGFSMAASVPLGEHMQKFRSFRE